MGSGSERFKRKQSLWLAEITETRLSVSTLKNPKARSKFYNSFLKKCSYFFGILPFRSRHPMTQLGQQL